MNDKTEIDRHLELVEWIRSGRARDLREKAELTRPMIAREVGVTRHTIMNWELGRCVPRSGKAASSYHRLLARLAEVQGASS